MIAWYSRAKSSFRRLIRSWRETAAAPSEATRSSGRDGAFNPCRLAMGFSSRTVHELAKTARLAARGFVLVQEHEVLLVELIEELVPGDWLEGLIAPAA